MVDCVHILIGQYKSKVDLWSLQDAIAYAFHEILDDSIFHLHKCQTVIKLATAISEKWNWGKIHHYIESKSYR